MSAYSVTNNSTIKINKYGVEWSTAVLNCGYDVTKIW